METANESLAKQFINNDGFKQFELRKNHGTTIDRESFLLMQPYLKQDYDGQHSDEPMDLTRSQEKFKNFHPSIEHQFNSLPFTTLPMNSQHQPLNQFFMKSKGKAPKIYGQPKATESKQAEILKDAKSLFSKRTRTLYHWMYPNTPKQHIKAAVASCWDKLGIQEKQFYISQVLVRFGFPQCNLMINPQLKMLGGPKNLPEMSEANGSVKEVQAAVSSISENYRQRMKRRQGRPTGSKNRKMNKYDVNTYKLAKEFQDDPELSKELEKFAISFDYFK